MKLLRSTALFLGLCAVALPLRAETLNDLLQPDPKGSYSYETPTASENGAFVIEVRDAAGNLYARIRNSAPELGKGHFVGPYELYYPSGQIKERRPVDDEGRFDGEALCWSDDGALMARVPYVKGRKNGKEVRFTRNGTVVLEIQWQDGQMTGPQRSYYADGQLESIVPRKNGWEDGVERMYHPNGTLQAEVHWTDGWRDGPYHDYDDKGHLKAQGVYVHGRIDGVETEFWPNGRKKEEHYRKMGTPVGSTREWRADGTLRAQTDYADDGSFQRERWFDPDGTETYLRVPVSVEGHGEGEKIVRREGNIVDTQIEAGNYDLMTRERNGKLIDRSETVDDEFIGLSISTSELEPETTTAHYVNGRLDGLWTRVWRDKVLDKGLYAHGKRVGKWRRVEQAGQVIHEFYDDRGNLDGEARTVNDQGELVKLATYKHGTLDGPYREMRDGKIRIGGLYDDGKKTGDWREQVPYHPLTRTGHYTDGLKDGDWRLLDDKGYVIEQARFADDKRDGPRYLFRSDGSLSEMQTWRNGRRDGYTTYFDGSGAVARDLWRDDQLEQSDLPVTTSDADR